MKKWLSPMAFALLLGLLLACFTLKKEERDLGYSQEARLNPYLAAGRVLEAQGMQVHFAPSYSHLPPHAHIIVITSSLE